MIKGLSSKRLFYISLFIVGYFGFLYLNYHLFKLNYILLGVVMEMITIPLALAQFILLIISFRYWRKEHFRIKNYSFWAFLILLLNCTWTLSSYIMAKF
ncbi:hypothetical protein SAMN05660776_2632 [Salegentibacter holothuriorum]|uniref:Uncharacterized protein n=1 Tax=Salegentibacter holothuriorum TaxID=241145 RepID=A0A1T5DH90_9FLAO|nr:hypothetical protein SAMN05660776_2632 [Salegentibacter holothuriorum]